MRTFQFVFNDPAIFFCKCHLSKVRPKAARLWRSVEANSEEEGKDHQEVGAQDGVLRLQVEEPGEQRTGDLHEQDLIKTT